MPARGPDALGSRWEPLLAPTLAAAVALAAWLLGWRGVDVPAALYRVSLFHRHGLTLWDSQWYGGHFTLDYSVIFPPVAGILGVQVTTVLSAIAAAVAFDRLVCGHFGRGARIGSSTFAIGTLVQAAIGQLPFLLGEALALAALWAAAGRRWRVAVALGVLASLASPLAGAFLALAAAAWMITSKPELRTRLACLVGAAGLPIAAVTLLFPGQGAMPFPSPDFLFEGALFLAVLLFVPPRERALRIGVGLYLVAFAVSFVLPTAVGGNIERLGETVGFPLALCVLWMVRHRLMAALGVGVLAILLFVIEWGPALPAFAANHADPSVHLSYFQPMLDYLSGHDTALSRVEVVPTADHWEAAYAAPLFPLARGWERQLDTADNPLFYAKGALNAASYRAWLLDNGVRYVALPDVRLDYAGVQEGKLVARGVPGLALVWHDAHWRVYAVDGTTGIVSGPARLVSLNGGDLLLDVTAPGTITVRERYSPRWVVTQGSGCTHQDDAGWLQVQALTPGPLHIQLRMLGPSGDAC